MHAHNLLEVVVQQMHKLSNDKLANKKKWGKEEGRGVKMTTELVTCAYTPRGIARFVYPCRGVVKL